MTMDELIEILRHNEDVGRNKPTTEVKIAIGVLRLKEAGFPDPGAEYHKLLRAFNGLSNNGCTILGINTENSLFPDLIAYNMREKENIRPGEVVLGYDDSYWLVGNPEQKKISDYRPRRRFGRRRNRISCGAYPLHYAYLGQNKNDGISEKKILETGKR